LHLDCSLSYEIVKKIRPEMSYEEYKASFIAPPKCTDLADYISRAISGVELMQTEEQLRLITLDLFDQLQADKVIYAEIRFAPLLHTQQGLSAEKVVQIVDDAVKEGIEKTGVKAGIILCTLRHFSEEEGMKTVELVDKFKGTKVVGFDLAADEAGFPIDNHLKAFKFAHEKGIKCTTHAGEAKGAESVWESLENFHPKRIGHGVRSVEDENLLRYLKENNIHLEVCPTSNIQTDVFPEIQNHSCNQIYETGISMSINTDARTISDVSLADEYHSLEKSFGWEKAHFLHCNLEAITHAFVSEAEKEELKKVLLAAYQ
ncbi:MAG: adenosine deaminase, partial [Bacteroidota bacterium]